MNAIIVPNPTRSFSGSDHIRPPTRRVSISWIQMVGKGAEIPETKPIHVQGKTENRSSKYPDIAPKKAPGKVSITGGASSTRVSVHVWNIFVERQS